MQKTTVNPNPEQEMTVNPFAQEQAAEIPVSYIPLLAHETTL